MSFSYIQQMLVDWNFSFFFSHNQIFVKMFFHYFFTVFILFKNCFNKSISSISTSINNNCFTKFIISTNKLITKTARNVIFTFFCVKTVIAFNTLKISINFKWSWYFSGIIFEFGETNFEFYSLFTIYY